jgi:hypothetical protein
MKEYDIYFFTYNAETLAALNKCYPGADRHCFEGILIARVVYVESKKIGKLMLCDTYWDIGSCNNEHGQRFTPEEAKRKGTLKYVGNLAELDEGCSSDYKYYQSKDLVVLHSQHACHDSCIKHYRRKNIQRDPDTMLSYIDSTIQKLISKRESLDSDIDQLKKNQQDIRSGNLNILLWC